MGRVPERRRGVCGSDICQGAITTWMQRYVRSKHGSVHAQVECVECGSGMTHAVA